MQTSKSAVAGTGTDRGFPVYVLDDNADMRRSLDALLTAYNFDVQSFSRPTDFLDQVELLTPGVLLLDLRMEEMNGLEVLERTKSFSEKFPTVMITGHGDIELAVKAIKAGAHDFIQKPFREDCLVKAIEQASERLNPQMGSAEGRHLPLSGREKDVAERLAAGLSNKQIAHELGISVRTVEMHRARAMQRLGCKTFAELLRILLARQ